MNSRRRAAALFAALLLAGGAAQAAPLPPPVRAEVDALLDRLQRSGCQFGRNGSWYEAGEARAHLLKKLAYLEDKNLVASSEDFIERAATRSSVSGQAYLVRCGGSQAAPVESRAWLSAELKALRAAAAPAGPSGSSARR
ncbi:DUF5329 family protein [Roseateles violae]|uniref:DUF5329 family protein n=1 Tax=Roseateles violae TaxID=3058042 RepID=A0ABT8DML1_9BURK|nr:DUF5329 family protein [Pelomonas sp. PFR6]MDN3919236.1 DUF5329 family protein [Pelomonas sp. PFR6]